MGETLKNDAIYVVVGQYVPESEKTLLWTLKKLLFKKIFLLNVHIPISLFPYCESNMNAYQASERKTTNNSLKKYRDICTNNGVAKEDVDTLVTVRDDIKVIDKEIVKLIRENNIKQLVMAAAADSHYSKGMSITSRTAQYVNEHASPDCKIWFICKGKLIKTREASEKDKEPTPPPSPRPAPKKEELIVINSEFALWSGILLATVIFLYETKRFIHFVEEFFSIAYAQLGINQFGFGFLTSVALFIFLVAGLVKPMFNDTTNKGNNKTKMRS